MENSEPEINSETENRGEKRKEKEREMNGNNTNKIEQTEENGKKEGR